MSAKEEVLRILDENRNAYAVVDALMDQPKLLIALALEAFKGNLLELFTVILEVKAGAVKLPTPLEREFVKGFEDGRPKA